MGWRVQRRPHHLTSDECPSRDGKRRGLLVGDGARTAAHLSGGTARIPRKLEREPTDLERLPGVQRDGRFWLPGPYTLRHAFATWMPDAGIELFELARLMGTSVAMIDKTYGAPSEGHVDRVRKRMNQRPSIAAGQSTVSPKATRPR
jgi:integrase